MRDLWGHADSLVRILDAARKSGVDITADVYPYLYWHSTLTVLFPKRDFENRTSAEFALTQTSTPGGLLLGHYEPNPSYAGKTVAEISKLRGTDSITTLIDLIRDSEAMRKRTGHSSESVIGTSMVEPDVELIMKWPYTNLSTDGSLDGPHPRGYGAFPRFLGRYVRERKVMPLEEAVHRMTSLAAEHMGIKDRGRITPGMFADLVLFDPATVIDRATPQEPHLVSVGIARVWVNGAEVFADGKTTTRTAGQGHTARWPVSEHRTAVVTGASTGIGYAIARVLIDHGVRVFGSVRRPEDGQRVRSDLGDQVRAARLRCDLTHPRFTPRTGSRGRARGCNAVRAREQRRHCQRWAVDLPASRGSSPAPRGQHTRSPCVTQAFCAASSVPTAREPGNRDASST
jgi:hypothetical protein